MKRLKKILPTVFTFLLLIVGVGILAYPTVSDRWNSRVQSRAVASYHEAVASLEEKDYAAILKVAEEYNEALKRMDPYEAFLHPEDIPDYEDTLDIMGSGMMGTITIDKIDVDLPVYHGTGADVLAKGAGHLQGSSLPIGGKGNHSVISAHRGLPSSKLFTNLDHMEIGDIFTLHILDNELDYEVDQITIVLPTEMENLYPEEGRDYCTLMTCTPYGINTHRLLVRGHRVYLTPEEIAEIETEAEQTSWPVRRIVEAAAVTAAGILVIFLLSEVFMLIMRKIK